MDDTHFKQIIRAVFAITNTQDIAVVGAYSLPLWLQYLPDNTMISKNQPQLEPKDTHVELCYYGDDKAADIIDGLVHSVFSMESLYAKRNNISAGMVDASELLPGWLERSKKFRVGRFSILAMHPTDLYHYMLPMDPDYAAALVTQKIVRGTWEDH